MIGTSNVVTKDVPDHSATIGNPAKVVKHIIQANNNGNELNKAEMLFLKMITFRIKARYIIGMEIFVGIHPVLGS